MKGPLCLRGPHRVLLSFSKTGGVLQSVLCEVPWGWQSAENCLQLLHSYGIQEHQFPWPPEPGTQGVSPGMLLQKHLIQNKNKNRLSDIYKSSTPRNTGMWNMAEGKHKDGPHQFLCPSRRHFTISKSVSFLYSLGTFQTSVTWSKKVCIQALPERSPVPPLGLVEASMILKDRCFAALSLRSYS